MINIGELRKEYSQQSLSEADVNPDAIKQFEKWWNEVVASKVEEVNAMTLATCNETGRPSARIVLLKGFNEKGFTFFTNYESRKGKELLINPHVCLVFFWKELERQVRVEGISKKISEAESDKYYLLRPEVSRIGAWSSPQSQIINGREILEKNVEYYKEIFSKENIYRPPFWGGYNVEPSVIEFWQGRPGRLHDRLQYTRYENGWQINRLAP